MAAASSSAAVGSDVQQQQNQVNPDPTNTKGKSISLDTFASWPAEIKQAFHFELNPSGSKYIRAFCQICRTHASAICAMYKGRLIKDVENYGKRGTTHLLLPNLKRHLNSCGHTKALDLNKTPVVEKNQSTLIKSQNKHILFSITTLFINTGITFICTVRLFQFISFILKTLKTINFKRHTCKLSFSPYKNAKIWKISEHPNYT